MCGRCATSFGVVCDYSKRPSKSRRAKVIEAAVTGDLFSSPFPGTSEDFFLSAGSDRGTGSDPPTPNEHRNSSSPGHVRSSLLFPLDGQLATYPDSLRYLFPTAHEFPPLWDDLLSNNDMASILSLSWEPTAGLEILLDPNTHHRVAFAVHQLLRRTQGYTLGSASPPPRPLSPFNPELPMPSSDCLFWMAARFWDRYWGLGPAGLVQRRPFLPNFSGPGASILWTMLWGACVLWDHRAASKLPLHSEFNECSKRVVTEHARTVVLGSLYQAIDFCNSVALASQNPLHPPTAADLLACARHIVPVLQSLVLGLILSEFSGQPRLMVSLLSLGIRLAKAASDALKGWSELCVARFTLSSPLEQTAATGSDYLELFFREQGIVRAVPVADSLLSNLVLEGMSDEEEEELILFAEFCASYHYLYGCEVWAADMLGSEIVIPDSNLRNVPVPFNAKPFVSSGGRRVARVGTYDPYNLTDKPTDPRNDPFSVYTIGILPLIPGSFILTVLDRDTPSEVRAIILKATITDIFRVGPHFLTYLVMNLEKRAILKRAEAIKLGYASLALADTSSEEAAMADLDIKFEKLRLAMIMEQVVEAFPVEIRTLESEGRIADIVDLFASCPSISYNQAHLITATFIWNYEFQVSSRSPPPGTEPDDGWYQSKEGVEAASNAVLGAKFVGNWLDCGHDPNSPQLIRWFHTRIERMMNVLFYHLRNARRHGLSIASLFEVSFTRCLCWIQGLKEQARYQEWLVRLHDLEPSSNTMERTTSTEFAAGAFYEVNNSTQRVVSAIDKALARFRVDMTDDLNGTVKTLVEEPGGWI